MILGIKDLVNASNVLQKEKIYAASLSLSIIALEECGKIFILDSLLFLRDKNDFYKKRSLSHKDKLDALQFTITLLATISEHHEDNKKDDTKVIFKKATQIGLSNLHSEYKSLRDKLKNSDIRQFDHIKQNGFYTGYFNNEFKNPSSNIDIKLAIQVNKFANLFMQNLDFIMNEKTISKYASWGKNIRGKVSQEDWIKIEQLLKVDGEEKKH